MALVYRPANTAEAHLIRQMLEAEGIAAYIQGEYMQGVIGGGLPATSMELAVCVADEHFDAACVVVDAWQSSEPAHFDDDVVEDDDAVESERQTPRANAGGDSGKKLLLLFFVVVIGGSLAMVLLRRYAEG